MENKEIDITFYSGLIFACSKGEPELSCPLRQLRTLPAEERVDVWNSMTDTEKLEIIRHHIRCLRGF